MNDPNYMPTQNLDITVGEHAEFEIDLYFKDGSPMDLAGLTGGDLLFLAKRYNWQEDDEAFISATLGDGLSILQPEGTPQSPAKIKATFTAEDTASFKVGSWFWALWRKDLGAATPAGFGLFKVSR
jgi:hypothetical protein